jgi:hypothetical protein
VSTQCFINNNLLPSPLAVQEKDFALVGVLGKDYATFPAIRSVMRSFALPPDFVDHGGYPVIWSIIQQFLAKWQTVDPIFVKPQKGLLSKKLPPRPTTPVKKLGTTKAGGDRDLKLSNGSPLAHRLVGVPNIHLSGSSSSPLSKGPLNSTNPVPQFHNSTAHQRPGSRKRVKRVGVDSPPPAKRKKLKPSSRSLEKFNLSSTVKFRKSKSRHKAQTSRTLRTWSKVMRNSLLSGNRTAKSSPNRIQDWCGIAFSFPSIVSSQTSVVAKPVTSQSEILSQEPRYPDHNGSPTSPSYTNDNCDDIGHNRSLRLSLTSQHEDVTGVAISKRLDSQIGGYDSLDGPSSPFLSSPRVHPANAESCNTSFQPEASGSDTKIESIIPKVSSSHPIPQLTPSIYLCLPFNVPRSVAKEEPMTMQSLKDLTGRLLMARQRARTTDFKQLWTISPITDRIVDMKQDCLYFTASFDGQLMSGIRLICLEKEGAPANSNSKLCAFGCKRDGKHQWISSTTYVLSIRQCN